MNYRHHFHAGNFADVMKHALLVRLWRALQAKDKGLFYLDTHAGRGGYDLNTAEQGDSLVRRPEYPDGIGRLWEKPTAPAEFADYLGLVHEFNRLARQIPAAELSPPVLSFYPGSPWLARRLARPQDRLAFCEKHPAECAALREEFAREPRTSIHERDGYAALRAMLPPPERRALVLIDPPFEAQREFAQVKESLEEGLRRLPGGVFALWYPLTERARTDLFFSELRALELPPTLVAELAIAGEGADLKMKGCGLVIVNPPWQFDRTAGPMMAFLATALAQKPGGSGRIEWLVPE